MKKELVEKAVENETKYLDSLTDKFVKNMFGLTKEQVLKVVEYSAGYSITKDLFNEFVSDSDGGKVFYISRKNLDETHIELNAEKKEFDLTFSPLGYKLRDMAGTFFPKDMDLGLRTVEDELLEAIGMEHAMEKDYKVLRAVFDSIKNKPVVKLSDANIMKELSLVEGDLYNSNKHGKINRIVAGSKFLDRLIKRKHFKRDDKSQSVGIFFFGALEDISVYVTPSDKGFIEPTEAFVYYKNDKMDVDIGVAYTCYQELVEQRGVIGRIDSIQIINNTFMQKVCI